MLEPSADNDARRKILDFIVETYAVDDGLDCDRELVRSEIIDSYGVVELIGFIEHEFAVSFPDEEIRPENFRSVADIAICVERLRAAA